MNRTFEWGVASATFVSALRTVPRHCARLTDFLHPKLRTLNAGLATLAYPSPVAPAVPLGQGPKPLLFSLGNTKK